MKYCSPKVQALENEATSTEDEAVRRSLYRRIDRIIASDVPVGLLVQSRLHVCVPRHYDRLRPEPVQSDVECLPMAIQPLTARGLRTDRQVIVMAAAQPF